MEKTLTEWSRAPKEQRFEYLQSKAEARGWSVVSKINEFSTFRDILFFRCDKGHEFKVMACHALESHRGCPICSGFHKTIERIQEIVEPAGWYCLNKEYAGPKHKYDFQCKKCSAIRSTRYHHIRDFPNCKNCQKLEKGRLEKQFKSLNKQANKLLKKKVS